MPEQEHKWNLRQAQKECPDCPALQLLLEICRGVSIPIGKVLDEMDAAERKFN